MSAIPFAGLAPDARVVRGRGELSSFGFRDAAQIGRDVRRASRGGSSAAVAAALVDALNAFEHEGRPAWVLLRIFVTCKLGELPAELADEVRRASPRAGHAEAPCLRLVASRGIEPAWNDVRTSAGHRALALDEGTPMLAELVRQLRIGDPAQPPAGIFYVAEASTNPAVTEKSFVTAYGVRSVVGFGATAWPGQTLIAIAFARAFVERAAVRPFETVALYAKLAWIESGTAREALGPAECENARARVLEELVQSHEAHLAEAVLEWRRSADAIRSEARHAAESSAAQVESQNRELRRTQRAMLNVVEDLREARKDLAAKVEARTRELVEANIELQARNRDLEEFGYIASHDLQEPLRTVAGYLQMIERRYGAKLGPEGDEFIRFAIDGAQRMQALIESLLLYSRVTAKQKAVERVALDEVVDVALQNLALRVEETHAVIERAPLPSLDADRIQLVQVFQNLLANALKFAGDRPPRVRLSAEVAEGVCLVTVRDEGIGFDQKFADRIFKIFRRLRRDTEGTGIGLAVCKKIIERHGGTIEARSSPGQGATFLIRLPIEAKIRGNS